jgi:ATP-binding protein involved in chromosome partitioning
MQLILSAASKGGVGKTLISLNLAYALKESGYKTGVLDSDITMPALTKYLKVEDITPQDDLNGVQPLNVNGVQIMSTGLLMDKSQPVLMDGEQRSYLVQQFIDKCHWDVDFLIIDTPPGAIDEIQYLIRQRHNDIHGVVVVTTPSDVAISQVRRSMALFKELNVRILGLVGNMCAFECPYCNSVSKFYDNYGVNPIYDLAREFKCGVIAELPIYPKIDEDPLHFVSVFKEALNANVVREENH